MTEHLNEQELDEVLLGASSISMDRHLSGCEVCRKKVDEFRATITLFNEVSLGWAQAKSHTLSRELPLRRAGWRAIPVNSLSFAAALLMALGLVWSAGIHRLADAGSSPTHAIVRDASSRAAAAGDSAGEIANDNAMLRDIDSALYKSEPSPADLYRDVNEASHPDFEQAQD